MEKQEILKNSKSHFYAESGKLIVTYSINHQPVTKEFSPYWIGLKLYYEQI